jgi:DNA-binding HxlR family transcriptional regulator
VPDQRHHGRSAIAGACSSSATSFSETVRYFRELQAGSEEGIASNILADRLKRLVELGLLTRENTRAGQRAHYSLTEPAIQLVPVFAQLGSWGLRHGPTSRALRIRAELLEQGGPALWEEFMDELRRSHLGSKSPARSLSVRERLNAAYLAATQLLVAARQSTMSKDADGRRPELSHM